MKLTDAHGGLTAPGIAGELQMAAGHAQGGWLGIGTKARWRSDGQLQRVGGFDGASFSEKPLGGAQSGQPAVAAEGMTETEHEMHLLWCELLGRRDIGLDDNFFDLGGYSLLAMRLLSSIELRMGKKVQPASLIELPTVRGLSALADRSKGQNALLRLRPGTGGPGVFFIHDIDGEVLLYRNLAMRLNARHPVYALRPHGDDSMPILHTRLSEMADHYVKQIRDVQPEGPYILAGLCAGGELAFEVACRLQHQGQRIAALALLESAHASAALRPQLLSQRRLSRLMHELNAGNGGTVLTRVMQGTLTMLRKTLSVVRYELGARLDQTRQDAQLRRLRRTLDEGSRPGAGSFRATVRQVIAYAQKTAQVHGRLIGDVLLLRAKSGDGTQGDQPFVEIFADPLFGWATAVDGKVVVADVEGGHSSMLQEPFVGSTQSVLQAYIDAALTVAHQPQPAPLSSTSIQAGSPNGELPLARDLAET